MRESLFKLLHAYLLQVITAVTNLDFYEEVRKDIEKQKANVLAIYNEFKKQIEDKDYLAKLSMQEQHALGKNELNYKKILREMDDSLSHLIKHKWSQNTRTALWMLDDARVFLEYILTGTQYDLVEIGHVVKANELMNYKKFNKKDYIGKTAACITVLEILMDDVANEIDNLIPQLDMVKFNLKVSLGKTIVILQQEISDSEVNGAPELFKFDIPEIVEPEIPDIAPAPEEKKEEPKQLELEMNEVKPHK